MLPDRLCLQAEILRECPVVGMLFGDYQNFSASGPIGKAHFMTCPRLQERLGGQRFTVLPPSDAKALLLRENVGIPSAMMMRREALEVAPSVSTDFRVGEDFHFYYRILSRFSLGIVDRVVSWRGIHNENITGDAIRMIRSIIASRSALCEIEQNRENLAALREVVHGCEITLARAYANRREFRRSVAHYFRAMQGGLPRRPQWIGEGMRGLIRTAAIAMTLK